jgi:drug/metabolite transporter (DMT)-like permease
VPASLAALIVYIYPALVAVLTLRFGRPLSGRRAWIALGLATAGVALAVGGIAPGTVPPLLGLSLALASPVIYSVWIILAARSGGERSDAERALPPVDAETASDPETTDAAPATTLMTTATFVVFWIAATVTGRPTTPADVPPEAWFGLIGVGLVSTALAMQTFYAGWRRIGAANASLVSTVEPVYTIVLATILFGEVLTGVQILGGVLVIVGVLLAQTGQVAVTAEQAGAPSAATSSPGAVS